MVHRSVGGRSPRTGNGTSWRAVSKIPAMSVAILERELYSLNQAARLLDMPPSTLGWWLEGRSKYAPVLRPEPKGTTNVTWGEFVEAGFLRA
jgi:hypothetical protein